MNVVIGDVSCVPYDQGSRIAPVSIGLGKANQLASSKILAKPNLRADCVSAFEQAWRRVEDVVVAGMRQKASGQKSLGLLFWPCQN